MVSAVRNHGLSVGDRVASGGAAKRFGTVKSVSKSRVVIRWEGYASDTSFSNMELDTYRIQKADAPVVQKPREESKPKNAEVRATEKEAIATTVIEDLPAASPKKERAIAPKTIEVKATEKESLTRVPIEKIRTDGGTQPRAEMDHAVMMEYAQEKAEGVTFPPVTVFFDGQDYWLADGFHRLSAEKINSSEAVDAIVKQGDRRDAILFSVGANSSHGLRRTNADKRRAVQRLLEDEEWSKWSDNQIGKACGVAVSFVGKLRKSSLFSENSEERTYTTKHGTTAIMSTSRIGKSGSESSILGIRTDREQLLPSIPSNPDVPPEREPQRKWKYGDIVRANSMGSDSFKEWIGRGSATVIKVEWPIEEKDAYNPCPLIWVQRSTKDGAVFKAWNNWIEEAPEPEPEEAIAEPSPITIAQPSPKAAFDPHGNPSDRTDEQYTPTYIWSLALDCFGVEQFALDPCSNSHTEPNILAEKYFTKEDDGLTQEWRAETLWLNPPYSDSRAWVQKLITEYEAGNVKQAIALVKADVSTKWFQMLLEYPLCLVNHRIKFINEANEGNSAKFSSAIVYFGENIADFYQTFDTRYSDEGVGIVVQAGVRGVHFGE